MSVRREVWQGTSFIHFILGKYCGEPHASIVGLHQHLLEDHPQKLQEGRELLARDKAESLRSLQRPRIPETSITTEKQGEEYVEYDEKDVKNEYVEYDEKDVKHEVKTEEDGVEEAVAAAVTGKEEVSP